MNNSKEIFNQIWMMIRSEVPTKSLMDEVLNREARIEAMEDKIHHEAVKKNGKKKGGYRRHVLTKNDLKLMASGFKKDLTDRQIARSIGCAANTVNAYRNGRGKLKQLPKS